MAQVGWRRTAAARYAARRLCSRNVQPGRRDIAHPFSPAQPRSHVASHGIAKELDRLGVRSRSAGAARPAAEARGHAAMTATHRRLGLAAVEATTSAI
jgi:hypothetical protein